MNLALETKYFITSCLLLIFLGGGGYYYHTQTLNQLTQEYNTRFQALTEELQHQNTSLTAVLEEQKIALESQISTVAEGQQQLTGELERVETQSAGEIAGLKEAIVDIDVESKGFTEIIASIKESIVSLRTDLGVGSGVVVAKDGYVLTNYHVVKDITKLAIVFANGKSYPGRIAGTDVKADLAVLKIGPRDDKEESFKPLSFGAFKDVSVGEKVIALGNPAGLEFTVTEGIVSSVSRTSPAGYPMIQTSVPINPGNSGGPLVDGNGLIVGINTYKLSQYESLGFAMNPDTAHQVAMKIVGKDRDLLAQMAQEQP